MRQGYPRDVTREQFEVVRHIFESFRKTTCPRKYDLYDIFCAILYIVKEGCTWRRLPHDFPKWRIVYRYFQMWGTVMESGQSLFEQAMHELAMSECIIKGRTPQPSMVIVDSKSVKNTDLPEEKSYNAGKNFRHKNTYWRGYKWTPHAIHVTTANVTDRKGTLEISEIYAPHLTNVVKALVDGGYTGEKFANAVKKLINAEVEVAKRSELHAFAVIPKRWVVERTFGCLDKYRRLWKNCERKISNTIQILIIASFIRLLVNRY